MLAAGHHIQAYEVLSHLGGGGFAEVYRVRHVGGGPEQALKLLRTEHQHPEVLERLRREARIQGEQIHPGIVPVRELIEDPQAGIVGIVMELFPEGSLAALLAGRSADEPLSPAFVRRLFRPLLEGLALLHAQGVIHRDIKPDNILLRRDAEGRLIGALADFGIARVPSGGERMTRDRQQMGTLEYMSPEQRLNPRNIDHRADIYAVGAAMLECLTLQPPDLGTPDLQPVRARDPVLAEVLDLALRPDREQRFSSCLEFALALQRPPIPSPVASSSAGSTAVLARLEAVERALSAPPPLPPPPPPQWTGLLGVELVAVGLGGSLLVAGGAPMAACLAGLAVGGALILATGWLIWREVPPARPLDLAEPLVGGVASAAALAWTWPVGPALHIALLWGLVPTLLVVLRLIPRVSAAAPVPAEVPEKRQTTLDV